MYKYVVPVGKTIRRNDGPNTLGKKAYCKDFQSTDLTFTEVVYGHGAQRSLSDIRLCINWKFDTLNEPCGIFQW